MAQKLEVYKCNDWQNTQGADAVLEAILEDNPARDTSNNPEITKRQTLHEASKALAVVQDYAVNIGDVDFLETVSKYHQCVQSTLDHFIFKKE